jgi:hypothetical protein
MQNCFVVDNFMESPSHAQLGVNFRPSRNKEDSHEINRRTVADVQLIANV